MAVQAEDADLHAAAAETVAAGAVYTENCRASNPCGWAKSAGLIRLIIVHHVWPLNLLFQLETDCHSALDSFFGKKKDR